MKEVEEKDPKAMASQPLIVDGYYNFKGKAYEPGQTYYVTNEVFDHFTKRMNQLAEKRRIRYEEEERKRRERLGPNLQNVEVQTQQGFTLEQVEQMINSATDRIRAEFAAKHTVNEFENQENPNGNDPPKLVGSPGVPPTKPRVTTVRPQT